MGKPHDLISVPASAITGVIERSFDGGELSHLAEDALESVLQNGADVYSPARHEDIDGLAEAVADEVLRDPGLRADIERAARRLLADLLSG